MTAQQSIRDALSKAKALARQHKEDLVRRCRNLAATDEGMRAAVANLDAALALVESLERATKEAQPKPAKPAARPKKTGATRRAGPTMSAAQNAVMDAVKPGEKITKRGLFQKMREKYPGRFRPEQVAGFNSTFTKKRKDRGDFTVAKEAIGSEPAVYMKISKTTSPTVGSLPP